MIFSYNWLQSFFKKKLPSPEKLAELLTFHFFEVEELKKVSGDWILDIDILPNRAADCFSHWGVAREIAAILGFKFEAPSFKLKEDKVLKSKDFILIDVKDKEVCSRYTARVINNVKVGPSPKWIIDRLKVCGLRPINNIVDIANYVMLETGQPLHTFDLEKIEGKKCKKIIVRFAKNGEKINALDEEKYDLDQNVLVIADEKDSLAIAGIRGGKKAEIDKKTKTIILESANFKPIFIRKASRQLNLRTDASLRFEHGIDPNLTEIAINRAAFLIQKVASAKVSQGIVDVFPKNVLPKIIRLELDCVEKLLGVKISTKEIKKIIINLGFKIKSQALKFIDVKVPTFRLDISIAEDLVEEIGRIFGYEKIVPVFPAASLIPPTRNYEIFWQDIVKNILKEAGFAEVYNYSFISENQAKILDYKIKNNSNLIELANPLSEEQKYLRPSLIPGILKNIKTNEKNFQEIKVFEIGKVFEKSSRHNLQVAETKMLTGAINGDAFHELKGVIDFLLNKLGISDIWYDSYQQVPEKSRISIWQLQRSAEIKINGQKIGFLGEISLKILKSFKIESRVVVFEVDFEKLQKLSSEETIYRPISRYPAAIRDISILVPLTIRIEEVLNKMEIAGGKLVKDIDLFDIYEGQELSEGKKSLSFHIIYQAENKTLDSKEVDELQNKIIKTLEENPEWEVRK